MEFDLEHPEDQIAFGARLAQALSPPCVLFLEGELGTGKTTLARGILQGFGYQGQVRSPTYTLLETYALGEIELYHLDLYRLADPDELEYLGLRDLWHERAIWLVEWPERGLGLLPQPDLRLQLTHKASGRHLSLIPLSQKGRAVSWELAATPYVSYKQQSRDNP